MARLAGVSQSTVSRALRGDGRVVAATRAKVVAAAAQLGYTPNQVGRSLVTRQTHTIAMVVTELSNPFYPLLVDPLHDRLAERGYRMVLFTERFDDEPAQPNRSLSRLLDRSIDGAVLTTSRLASPIPAQLREWGLPFVFLIRVVDDVAADCAVVDSVLGASCIAHEIIRLGHRRIAGIFGSTDTSTGRDRERGFRRALAQAGISIASDHTRHGQFDAESGYLAMQELMDCPTRPTVVWCGNDTMAIGALNAARALGMRVPQDISIAGFDDLPMAAWEVFQLTTVHQPLEEMASAAAELLIDRIEGRGASGADRRVFQPRLVVRKTLGPA